MNESLLKSILVVKSCSILLAEEMDKIKNSNIYSQKIKNLTNNLSKELDIQYEKTYKLFDDEESEQGFNYIVKLIENFQKIISSAKSPEELLEISLVLESIKNKNYNLVEL